MTKNVAQLMECLPTMHRATSTVPGAEHHEAERGDETSFVQNEIIPILISVKQILQSMEFLFLLGCVHLTVALGEMSD